MPCASRGRWRDRKYKRLYISVKKKKLNSRNTYKHKIDKERIYFMNNKIKKILTKIQ